MSVGACGRVQWATGRKRTREERAPTTTTNAGGELIDTHIAICRVPRESWRDAELAQPCTVAAEAGAEANVATPAESLLPVAASDVGEGGSSGYVRVLAAASASPSLSAPPASALAAALALELPSSCARMSACIHSSISSSTTPSRRATNAPLEIQIKLK